MHCFKPCLIWTMLKMNTSCIVVLKKCILKQRTLQEASYCIGHLQRVWYFREVERLILCRQMFYVLEIQTTITSPSTARKDNSYWHLLIQCIPLIICSQTKIILNKKMKIVTKVEISWHIFWIDSYLSYVFLRHQMHVAIWTLCWSK